jgi:hypothetical protein
MGPTVDQVEEHIEGSREDLHSNLEELGQKVRSAVDWRERFRSNPGALLAVAFGSGFILAKILAGSRTRGADNSPLSRRARSLTGAVEDRKAHVLRAWDDIRSALAGAVAAKVANTLAEVVPGFKEHLPGRDDDGRVVNGGSGPH